MTIEDIAMIKEEDKKHGKWNIRITSEIFKERTNERRAVRVDINWILTSTNPVTMELATKMI